MKDICLRGLRVGGAHGLELGGEVISNSPVFSNTSR